MPYCPKCKYEYNYGQAKCPDCDEYLVNNLPEETGEETLNDEKIDWIPLCRLTSNQISEMLVEALESKGIRALVHSGAGHFGITGQMGASSFRPIGGAYTIMVGRENANDASIEAEIILGPDWSKVKLV